LREALESLPRHGKRVFRFTDGRMTGGAAVTDRAVGNRVAEVAGRAGVRLTYKSLRRGFGCYWAARVPAQILQKLMRHAHISLTMTYYANVDDAVMNAVLGGRNSSRNTGPQTPAAAAPENDATLCPKGESGLDS
jgi:integrase